MRINIPDLGSFSEDCGLKCLAKCSDGRFEAGKDGVTGIYATGDGKVEFIRSETDGIFLPRSKHNHFVNVGEPIGEIVDPMTGQLKSRITAGRDGLLFTLRNYPVVYEGDLLARILTGIM